MNETISAYADPEGEAPWAMQFVVRVEKATPPTHTGVVTAVARACVLLLADIEQRPTATTPAADTDPSGTAGMSDVEKVARWRAGRIRKVVRRARGAAWTASDLPGSMTFDLDGVQVRAFVPGPTDQVPAELRKLQVSGLDLTDPDAQATTADADTACVVFLNPTVRLSTGKEAAQVAHAAQLVLEQTTGTARENWVAAGAPVTVVAPEPHRWTTVADTAPVAITDAGFTEIAPGTRTCVARHNL